MVTRPVGKWVRARTQGDARELSQEYQKSAKLVRGWSRRQTLLWAAALVLLLAAGVVIGFVT